MTATVREDRKLVTGMVLIECTPDLHFNWAPLYTSRDAHFGQMPFFMTPPDGDPGPPSPSPGADFASAAWQWLRAE